MIDPVISALTLDAADSVGLPFALVTAIVQVESGGNRYAWNPEPRYRYLWNVKTQRPFRSVLPVELAAKFPPKDFPALAGDPDQEWWGQQASWGLMQIMGAVAREQGFDAPYLPELTDPAANLLVGCRHLRGLVQWADGDLPRAAAAYNAGKGGWMLPAGQAYRAKVKAAGGFN